MKVRADDVTIKSWYSAKAGGWLAEADYHGQHLAVGTATLFESQAVGTVRDAVNRIHWEERGVVTTSYSPPDKEEHGW